MEKNSKKNRHEIEFKISGKEWDEALKKAYEKNNKKAKIDGFRPGKAPFEIYVKHYGIESLYLDAADTLVEKSYLQVIDDNKLIPVTKPSVDIKSIDKEGVTFKFVVITKPELKIKKYKDLKIKKGKVKVTEKEIKEEIDKLLENYAELVIKDGKAENGDTVVIDYEGLKDGVAFEGGTASNYSLILGSNTFIPGFEEQLVGTTKDEEKDVNVTFPEDYHAEDLKGQKVTFKVKVHEVKTKVTRELDKEFFEDLGMEGVDSLESLKEEIKNHLESHQKTDIENKFFDDILDAIGKNTDVDIPDEMVDDEIERLIERIEENLKYQGLTLDLYYQFTKTTAEDLRNNLEKEAFKNVLNRLILEELIILEDIKVEEDEIKEHVKNIASKYQTTEEDIIKQLGGNDMISYDLQMKKVFEKLTEYNQVK